jgi:hypothetical protein
LPPTIERKCNAKLIENYANLGIGKNIFKGKLIF